MSSHLARLRLMVERVTDVVFNPNGVATSKGVGGNDLQSSVGWHFGFYSRPKDGARGAVLKADGQGNHSFLFCWRDKQYEMSLNKGECGMQNAFSAYLLLNQDGVLELNGNSYKAMLGELVKAAFDAHIHGTPVGPSGPPTVALPNSTLSDKVKLS